MLQYECLLTDCDTTELKLDDEPYDLSTAIQFEDAPFAVPLTLFDTKSKYCGNTNQDGFTFCSNKVRSLLRPRYTDTGLEAEFSSFSLVGVDAEISF